MNNLNRPSGTPSPAPGSGPERQAAPAVTPEQRAQNVIREAHGKLNALRQQIEKAGKITEENRKQNEAVRKILSEPGLVAAPELKAFHERMNNFVTNFPVAFEDAQNQLRALDESAPQALAGPTLSDRIQDGFLRMADNPQVQGLFARLGMTPEGIRNLLDSMRGSLAEWLGSIKEPAFLANIASETAAGLQWNLMVECTPSAQNAPLAVRTRWINCYKKFLEIRRNRPNATLTAPEFSDAQSADNAQGYEKRLIAAGNAPAATPAAAAAERPPVIGSINFGTNDIVPLAGTPLVIQDAPREAITIRKNGAGVVEIKVGTAPAPERIITLARGAAPADNVTDVRLRRPATGGNVADIRVQIDSDTGNAITVSQIRSNLAANPAATRAVIDGSLNPFN